MVALQRLYQVRNFCGLETKHLTDLFQSIHRCTGVYSVSDYDEEAFQYLRNHMYAKAAQLLGLPSVSDEEKARLFAAHPVPSRHIEGLSTVYYQLLENTDASEAHPSDDAVVWEQWREYVRTQIGVVNV